MNYAKVIEDLGKFERTFQGMFDLAREMQRVGSVEQATKESEERLAKATTEEAELKETIFKLGDKASEVSDQLKAMVDKAQAQAKGIIETARAQARQADEDIKMVRQEAQNEQQRLIEEGQLKVTSILADADRKLIEIREEEGALRDRIAARKVDVDKLTEQRDALTSELARLKSKFGG